MKRDFSHENILNIMFRGWRALLGRARGSLYKRVGFFSPGTGGHLFFGAGVRMINPGLMKLGDDVSFGVNARVECFATAEDKLGPKLVIGEGTTFGDGVHIGSINHIEIGKNVLFGSYVLIVDHAHGSPSNDIKEQSISKPLDRPIISKAGVKIGARCWIGDGVVILPGAEIGDGAIIAANTVVRGVVEQRTIYTGINT